MTPPGAAAWPPSESEGAVAVGWATVELDRATRELAGLLPAEAVFADAPPSDVLGARCRVASADGPDGVRIVLLEPATEGRLAATLARHGEGWATAWYTAPPADGPDGTEILGWSAPRPGPFGPERLATGGPIAGPHRLRLGGDTIEP